MRLSTMKGIAVGSLMGMTVGAGLRRTPHGKPRTRVLSKTGSHWARQVVDCWMN